MKKRFIFALNGTLLHMSYKKEEEYFKSVLTNEEQEKFFSKYMDALAEYENKFAKYDVNDLSKFLSKQTNVNITPDMIDKWIEINGNPDDILLVETVNMLEYLKSKKYSLVVLTKWFLKTQRMRLETSGILKYFDDIYTGELYIKPSKESYLNACGNYNKRQCIVIGDDLKNDVYGPNKAGIDSIYYNLGNKPCDKTKVLSINSFYKIKEMF